MPTRFESVAYGPELTALMRDAFDEAWLKFADHVSDTNLTRNLLASAIIDAIDAGIRDHDAIVSHAVATFATATNIADHSRG
jgi:hypothetical protein